jgi:hypothetical protein
MPRFVRSNIVRVLGVPDFVPSAITGDINKALGDDALSKGFVLEGRGIWGCSTLAGRNILDKSTLVEGVEVGPAACTTMGKPVRGVLHIKAPATLRRMDRRVESDSCGVDCTIVAGDVVPQCVLVGLVYDATNWP